MIVTLYRPFPADGPWILESHLGDLAFVHPPEAIVKRIDGQNGEVEAELGADGEWAFPQA